MITGFVLVAVGMGDLVRAIRPAWLGWLSALVAWGLLVPLAILVAGLPAPVAVAPIVVAAGWSLASEGLRGGVPRLWPAVLLAVLLVASVIVDSAGLVDSVTVEVVPGAPLDTAVVAVGGGLVLLRTANLVARAGLAQARRRPSGTIRPEAHARADAPPLSDPSRAGRGGWELRIAGRRVGRIVPAATRPPTAPLLRGGRLIGPLERILILVLAVAGAYPALAALVAAKGIVRFPEISEDRGTGAKAEEFLIGSLISWTVAAGVAIILLSPAA